MSALGVVMPAHFFRSYWIPKCHCTLIYLGEHDKVPHVMHQRKMVEAAVARLNLQFRELTVPVKGVELFGRKDKTVLVLEEWVLKSYRRFIDRELAREGIRSASEFAYRPHITINSHEPSDKPVFPWPNFVVPSHVYISAPELWWASPDGDQ